MITIHQVCEYEVVASWWAGGVSNERLQRLAGKYYAWKTKRKFARYAKSMALRAYLEGKKS